MTSESIPRRLIQQLIFGGAAVDQEAIEEGLEKLDHETRPATDTVEHRTKPSKYVEVFEDMIRTLCEPERYLLSDEEWEIIERFQRFSYNTRYCLCRLVLRKPNQWHPLSSLTKYKAEVGEEGFEKSMSDLCQPFDSLENPMKQELEEQVTQFFVKEEDLASKQDIIDLTIDSDEEDVKPSIQNEPVAGPPRISVDDQVRAILEFDSANLQLSYFCQDETTMSLYEILERLPVEDLRDLTKSTRSKPSKPNKHFYIAALLNTACSQSVLDFPQTPKAKSTSESCQGSLQQTRLPFLSVKKTFKGRKLTQEERLREMALKKLGRCVRVNYNFFRLIRRLHIISYRSTEHPPSLLLPALLTSFKKRTYAAYKHTRDPAIWTTREELLNYELALELEAKIDEILESKPETWGTVPSRKFRTPATPGAERATRSPVTTRRSNSVAQEMATGAGGTILEAEGEGHPQIRKAKKMKEIFATIYSKWKELVCLKQEQGIIPRTPGLERFQPGYVYTRLVNKCLIAFRTLQEYESELEVLDELLKQRLWRRGKRARWYERRAIILMHHLCPKDGVDVVPVLRKAINGVREALEDEDTGIVWRPSLLRRLRRLENKLQIPPEERATCEGNLRKAEQVYMHAIRIRHRANSLKLDKLWRPIKDDASALTSLGEGNMGVRSTSSVNDEQPVFKKSTGKSIWQGMNKEEVNVETVALQYYNAFDFKGFHSETRILTTLFALLFWDVIFADVRGAFETPYQTAPLDLCEDSFYFARKDLIDTRLREIREGRGKEILERHDELHRPQGTYCVGVQWDLCGKGELVEIVECLGGESLAMICQLFCEDYAGRSSGVPDLIVWNVTKRICKFVEVKGPGDTLQENQKLWVDSLLGAKAAVEICNVIDSTDAKNVEQHAKKRKSSTSSSKRKKTKAAEVESQEEDYEQLDHSDGPTLDMANAPPRKRRHIPTTSPKVDGDT